MRIAKPERTVIDGDDYLITSRISQLPRGWPDCELWFRLPCQYVDFVGDGSDPFVVALLPLAMRSRSEIIVEDTVSSYLLEGCSQSQTIFAVVRMACRSAPRCAALRRDGATARAGCACRP